MKNTLSLFALGTAALTLAAATLAAAPAAAKTKHSAKRHTRKHSAAHPKMHMTGMRHTQPSASTTLTPAPGTIGPARTGTGPSPTTGHVTGTVPNAVGDTGQVNPPSAPTGGGVTQ